MKVCKGKISDVHWTKKICFPDTKQKDAYYFTNRKHRVDLVLQCEANTKNQTRQNYKEFFLKNLNENFKLLTEPVKVLSFLVQSIA